MPVTSFHAATHRSCAARAAGAAAPALAAHANVATAPLGAALMRAPLRCRTAARRDGRRLGTALGGALLAAAACWVGEASARVTVRASCDISSDYDFALTQKSVILIRDGDGDGDGEGEGDGEGDGDGEGEGEGHGDGAASRTIVMRQGRLIVDGRIIEVSSADAERLRRYETGARAVMPLTQAMARDASEIAFGALGAVARGFSSDAAAVDARMAQARRQLDADLAHNITPTQFRADALGSGIAAAISRVLPSLIGDITGSAVRAALTGDTSRFDRLEHIDATIEAQVAPRAKALEANAHQLCERMRALDALDDALELRIDGRPLDLIRVKASQRLDAAAADAG